MTFFYKFRGVTQWGIVLGIVASTFTAQAQSSADPLTGQTVNGEPLNYVSTTTVLQPGVTDATTISSLLTANRQQAVGYTDGFGRPLQTIAVKASPGGGDIISPTVYDQYGSVPTQSLPYTNLSNPQGLFDANATANRQSFYLSSSKVAHDTQPYTTTTYEASPLGRVATVSKPGAAFGAHPATISYQTNTGTTDVTAVRIWQGTSSPGVYGANQLNVKAITDEDGRQAQIFQDNLGRIILQRKIESLSGGGTNLLDTYSVYDASGDLIYTIPPGAIGQMRTSGTWSLADPTLANTWLFQYTYDDLHRIIERKTPGAAVIYIVYDQFDRPILVQDGTHRAAGTWLFTKYDELSRAVVEGVYNRPNTSRAQLQTEADAATGEYESRSAIQYGSTTSRGYTTTATYPAIEEGNTGSLLSITSYDDYDLDQNGGPDFSYRSQALGLGTEPIASPLTRGRPTVSQKRILFSGNVLGGWLVTALFYDEYGNVIQRQSNSLPSTDTSLPNTTTLVYRAGGFVPQVLRTIKKQTSSTGGNVAVVNRFTYLPAGQLSAVWQQNTHGTTVDPEVLVASYAYNEAGQLVKKNLHSQDNGATFLQAEDFRYNLLGQVLHINNSALQNDGGVTNEDTNDIFGLDIAREEGNSQNIGNVARYDGGISAISWQSHNAQQQNNPERVRSYRFTYDGLGRLHDAQFAAKDASGSWTQEVGAYDEKGITYDLNGNITALNRFTQRWSGYTEQIDRLGYQYNGGLGGNQLTGVYDGTGDSRGLKYNSSNTHYVYDVNGNLTVDPNKDLFLQYNLLNKVDQQSVGQNNGTGLSNTITYDYDAAGTVLRRTITTPNYGGQTLTKTLTYVDGFVYESSATQTGLTSVPTPEGRALLLSSNSAKLVYEYHLRDHLGNLRVAFRADRQVDQLHLNMEDPSTEEGVYPKFQNVAATQSRPGKYGSYSAALTTGQEGPVTRIPVVQGDQLKVNLYYATPNGVQYFPPQPGDPKPPGPIYDSFTTTPTWSIAPALLSPTLPSQREAGALARPGLGLQVSAMGLLTKLLGKKSVTPRSLSSLSSNSITFEPAPDQELAEAYVAIRVYDQQNNFIQQWRQVAPVTTHSDFVFGWNQLSFLVTPDLSNLSSKAGYVEIQLLNDGSQPVYFDSLTIRHPKDVVLVSQENHYYPLGLALSGVAVNTYAQPQASKALYNAGSQLEDDVLGDAGIYSTFYRNYDPVIGRFQGVDPLANQTADWSPYQFALGNPISANDPTGAITWDEIISAIAKLMAEDGNSAGPDGYSWSADGGAGRINSNSDGTYTNSIQTQSMDKITDGQGHYYSVPNGYTTTTTTAYNPPSILSQVSSISPGEVYNTLDAVLGTVGGLAEIAGGIAGEGFTGGVSTFLVVDGFYRVALNGSKLLSYATGNKEVGDALPSNLGALTGKVIDGARGSDWHNTGSFQAGLGLANDLVSVSIGGGLLVPGAYTSESSLVRYTAPFAAASNGLALFDDATTLSQYH